MDLDDLMKIALDAGKGMMVTSGLYALEGNAKENTLKVVPLHEFQITNLVHFITNRLRDSLLMGIFTTREAAEEHIIYLRTMVKDENGKIIK